MECRSSTAALSLSSYCRCQWRLTSVATENVSSHCRFFAPRENLSEHDNDAVAGIRPPRTGAATCRLCLRIRHGVDSNKRDVVDTKPEYVTKPVAPGGDQASAIVNMLQK